MPIEGCSCCCLTKAVATVTVARVTSVSLHITVTLTHGVGPDGEEGHWKVKVLTTGVKKVCDVKSTVSMVLHDGVCMRVCA